MKNDIKLELPPGITVEDTKWGGSADANVYALGNSGQITFYKTSLGWVITTLGIANSTRGQAARSYAITLDGAICRVGQGPHVTAQVTIYIKASRVEALKKYTDLYTKGMVAAGTTRDRISSRRAEGSQMRAEGHHTWHWSV